MNEENRCPQCGAALPAHAPQGLCPGCLLKRGLDTHTEGSQGGSQASAAECAPPTPEEMAALFPDLEILELVGRGGMGVVYKARQKRLDRLVALKILSPRFSQDAAFAERFVREAQAMAMLSHPHVVAVYDFGEIDGLYYFLMEFVDGVNLRRLLDTGKLASEEALAIVPQICDALQYAHDHGVVHRDIKPENVLLDKEGRVKIADFGIAKLVGVQDSGLEALDSGVSDDALPESTAPSPEPLTAAGQVMGTPQYMAPEQIEHPLEVDHRADIYSLGVVFYQMLTGELPTGRFTPPSKKVRIDVRLDDVVLRALESEPQRRYQQVSEIKTEVEGIAETPRESGEFAEQAPTSGSPPKVSMCYLSTPEHLRSFRGRFIGIYKAKGELRLDSETLRFSSGWQTVVIPLSTIHRIAQGDYPYSARPLPIHYIEITFVEYGVERTLLFTPVHREIMLPDGVNEVVADWLSALQKAVQANTGRTLSVELSQLARDKFWWAKAMLLTAGLAVVILMILQYLDQREPKQLSDLLFIIIFPIVLMLVYTALGWRSRSAFVLGKQDSLVSGTIGAHDKLDPQPVSLLERAFPETRDWAIQFRSRWMTPVRTHQGKRVVNWPAVCFTTAAIAGFIASLIILPIKLSDIIFDRNSFVQNPKAGGILLPALVFAAIGMASYVRWTLRAGNRSVGVDLSKPTDSPPSADVSVLEEPTTDEPTQKTPWSWKSVPWQIWIVAAVLALESLGNLSMISTQPQAAIWFLAKCLFVVGLLRAWKWVFVLFLIEAAIHVVGFLIPASLVAAMNLLLLGLSGSAYRFYFPVSAKSSTRPPGFTRNFTVRDVAMVIFGFLLLFLGPMLVGRFIQSQPAVRVHLVAERAAVAEALEEYRKTLVVYDLGPLSVTSEENWKHYDAKRLQAYPTKDAWPEMVGQVNKYTKSFKIIWERSSISTPINGPIAFMVPLDKLSLSDEYATLLFFKGISRKGMVLAESFTSLVCLGDMEGGLNFHSFATAMVKGEVSGRISSQSHINLVVTGKFTGLIRADSNAMIYLLGGCDGNLKLNDHAKVYIAGRTTKADLSRITGKGNVYLEQSDLPAGQHKIGDLKVTVAAQKANTTEDDIDKAAKACTF